MFTVEDKINAIDILRKNMKTQQRWIKVHAAEYLLWSGNPKDVKDEFLKEEELHGNELPYRIGIWRVLAQAETDSTQKAFWIEKIKQAFLNKNGADRLHAIESLAKLRISPFIEDEQFSRTLDIMDNFEIYQLWSFAYVSDKQFYTSQDLLLKLATSTDNSSFVRATSSYALKRMGKLSFPSWTFLAESALTDVSPAKPNLLNAAIITATDKSSRTDLYDKLWNELISVYKKENNNILRTLLLDSFSNGENGQHSEIIDSIFQEMQDLKDPESIDVLSTCAYAICQLTSKN